MLFRNFIISTKLFPVFFSIPYWYFFPLCSYPHGVLHIPPQLPLYLGTVENWLVGGTVMIQRLFTWRLPVVVLCITAVITWQLILLLENCCEDHKNTILLTAAGSFAWYSGREHWEWRSVLHFSPLVMDFPFFQC